MNEDITVVIAIGGKGTRLKNITGEIPKPLYPIVGTSTLKKEHLTNLPNMDLKN